VEASKVSCERKDMSEATLSLSSSLVSPPPLPARLWAAASARAPADSQSMKVVTNWRTSTLQTSYLLFLPISSLPEVSANSCRRDAGDGRSTASLVHGLSSFFKKNE
jgi:hypothetical protein